MPFKGIQSHQFWYQSKAHIRLPLAIDTNLPPILHRFQDITFDRSKIAIFGYPLAFKSPRRRGSIGTISVKFSGMSTDGQGTKKRRNIAENFNRLSTADECYRRQTTDGRVTAYVI